MSFNVVKQQEQEGAKKKRKLNSSGIVDSIVDSIGNCSTLQMQNIVQRSGVATQLALISLHFAFQ